MDSYLVEYISEYSSLAFLIWQLTPVRHNLRCTGGVFNTQVNAELDTDRQI